MPEVRNVSSQTALMEEIHMDTTVLVVGGGWHGMKVAYELACIGYQVVLIENGTSIGGKAPGDHLVSTSEQELSVLLKKVKDHEAIEVLASTRLVALSGVPGDFRIRLEQDGQALEKAAGAVVVALEAERVPMLEAYRLNPGENALSQSQIERMLDSPEEKDRFCGEDSKDVLFLVGLQQEGNPLVMERALRSAIELQDTGGCQATILVGNVKLAHDGLETLYKQSRERGVLYFKLRESPLITQNGLNFQIKFFDGVLHGDVELTPDVLVVEEAIRPHPQAPDLARVLRIDTDPEGFFQPDNVHYLPVRSNREGIYVIGSARQSSNLRHGWTDVQNAVLAVRQLLGEGKRLVPREKAKIHRGKCTICLTCFRVCPHGAIYWDNRAVISPVACQGCGICASECPMDAIQLVDYRDDQIEAQIFELGNINSNTPQIIAFCCQNSAYEAGQMARLFGSSLPEGLQMIKVPCAGKVDVDYILKAFQAGADGVLVLACHKDNCKSQQGNTFAEWRVEDATRMLAEVGLETERLRFITLASNMPVEFVRITREIEDKLREMGPSPMKKQALAKTAS
ncbi:MAG: hydrogenase iron-sulfur subunit [Deltaproteobacteria bacterium]|nr:hydrogenase iron-sulfur subunit [Deltaproteobacteria bacterium]MBW2073406.1 hydrogenase iron-sulfur subunit [Deltaproteobacteria bacterium]